MLLGCVGRGFDVGQIGLMQDLAQAFARFMQAPANRPWRALKLQRNLAIAQSGVVAQHDDGALLRGEMPQGVGDRVELLECRQNLVGAG